MTDDHESVNYQADWKRTVLGHFLIVLNQQKLFAVSLKNTIMNRK